jgi:hypothetical protein
MDMGLHAGLYTQHLSNRGASVVHNRDTSQREDQSSFMKEFLKNVSNQTICTQCRQKLIPDKGMPEWLGEREEGP